MSYSFGFIDETKSGARLRASAEITKVKAMQPDHTTDLDAVEATLNIFIDMLAFESETLNHVKVVCYGSLGKSYANGEDRVGAVSGVTATIQVNLVNPEAP